MRVRPGGSPRVETGLPDLFSLDLLWQVAAKLSIRAEEYEPPMRPGEILLCRAGYAGISPGKQGRQEEFAPCWVNSRAQGYAQS